MEFHTNVFYNKQKTYFSHKIDYIMPRPSTTLYPNSLRALAALGQRLKDARLRRHFSAETVATRAGMTRQTLSKIESGNPSVTMGNYFQVMTVLGLDKDMSNVALDDVLGRRLQDAELPQRKRAPATHPHRVAQDASGAAEAKEVETAPPDGKGN
ncbi:helix-turn-helix domain-containing protein [Janthinobacterium sp. HLX7-2]|uniref:helix-turn-helix domain-containing protein n=1 Tax=Janthinobacterium sp. HLX7-2 TaxID=1259331 RepID=UPI003F1F44B4